jgi:hypothetical protein
MSSVASLDPVSLEVLDEVVADLCGISLHVEIMNGRASTPLGGLLLSLAGNVCKVAHGVELCEEEAPEVLAFTDEREQEFTALGGDAILKRRKYWRDRWFASTADELDELDDSTRTNERAS